MAGAPESGQERSEAPTRRRLERAREAGQVAISREAVLFAVLAAATLFALWHAPASGAALASALRGLIQHAASGSADPAAVARAAFLAGAGAAAPALLTLAASVAGATLLQTGGLISAAALRPSLARVSPVAGARRLFGPEGLADVIRSLLKLGLLGAALWWLLGAWLVREQAAPPPPAARLASVLLDGTGRLLGALLLVQAAVAGLDLLWVRFRFLGRLRMSRQEIRDEIKEAEGDPRIKQRLRRLRLARTRRRMLAAVPKAAVVVTNPTHYAVALAYDRASKGAPRVVAKGVDSMAERIREVARAHRIPLVPNPPLARALHRLELDQEIPAEHYKAVAEIIAYVWRLRDRARAA